MVKPQNYEEMHEFARANGLEATKTLLREYVKSGEPTDFMPGYTTRAMCRAAAAGLEGIPVDRIPLTYLHTRYGPELYFAMWSGE